jgi:4-amino-4-deoxy-L-arabinose transferase
MALVLRIVGIDSLPHNYDEPWNIRIIDSIHFANFDLPLYAFQHPPLSVYVLKVGVLLFGENNFGYRFMNALVGACSVLLIYDLARRGFGRRAGLLSALLLATNRFHIGWSRQVNQEVLYLALVVLSLSLFWRVYQGRRGWLMLGVVGALALLAKELSVMLLPVFLLFLVTGERGRRLLVQRDLYVGLAVFLGVALLILLYGIQHPGRAETYLHGNILRMANVGFSVEPLEFFLRPSTTHDIPLAEAWRYPYMFWPTGVLLLAGVLYSASQWKQDFVRLMLTIFGLYFVFFTFVGNDPGRTPPHSGEFWWVDVALIPAIALTARMLLDFEQRSRRIRRVSWIVPVYLVANAVFFVGITKNGPVLRFLSTTYEDVVARFPLLL